MNLTERTREPAVAATGEKTWEQAKKELTGKLSPFLDEKQAVRRAELLLRTHTFRGYAATRYRTLMAQTDVFPFWQYKTHGDGRVRPAHAALQGKIFPAGHPIWQKIFPPWGWGCRCLVVPMMKKEVGRMKDEEQGKAPENRRVYDGEMADAIHAGERLPNAVSLHADNNWNWQPGTLRPDLAALKKRYEDHDPEAWAEFERWARSANVEGGGAGSGQKIWSWLEGEPLRAQARFPRASLLDPADAPVVAAWTERLKKARVANPVEVAEIASITGDESPDTRRGLQSLLDLLPREVAGAAGKFTVEHVDSLPDGAMAEWHGGVMKVAAAARSDPMKLRAALWHEMAHWLWDGAARHPRLAAWRKALSAHYAARTAGELPQTNAAGWGFLRDKWIDDYAGRIYAGRDPGVELPAVYLQEASAGPANLAAWEIDRSFNETFDLVLSILGEP